MPHGCPGPRRPPSELGGDVPALTSCLPPSSRLLHLYAAVFFGSSSSINISRFPFPAVTVCFRSPGAGWTSSHRCAVSVLEAFGSGACISGYLGSRLLFVSFVTEGEKSFEKHQTVSAGFRDLLSDLLRILFCRYFPHRRRQPCSPPKALSYLASWPIPWLPGLRSPPLLCFNLSLASFYCHLSGLTSLLGWAAPALFQECESSACWINFLFHMGSSSLHK